MTQIHCTVHRGEKIKLGKENGCEHKKIQYEQATKIR